jgi:hypothetical protein
MWPRLDRPGARHPLCPGKDVFFLLKITFFFFFFYLPQATRHHRLARAQKNILEKIFFTVHLQIKQYRRDVDKRITIDNSYNHGAEAGRGRLVAVAAAAATAEGPLGSAGGVVATAA